MIKPIILYGDPSLRQPSYPISSRYSNLEEIINDMFETMHKAKGIGLSAIQIGVPIRLFVIEITIEEEQYHFKDVFINPEILEESDETERYLEGCLSIPGLTGFVERPKEITIQYLNRKREKINKTFSGREARIIQHEYDHLFGELYTDKLGFMWQKVLEAPLEVIKERKVKPNYLTK